jgi:hypothetical protein
VTIPCERTRALTHTYELLKRLQDPRDTPRVPRWLRGHAKALLRHYPDYSAIQMAHRALPHLYGPVPPTPGADGAPQPKTTGPKAPKSGV